VAIDTSNLDSGSDKPKDARAALLAAVQQINATAALVTDLDTSLLQSQLARQASNPSLPGIYSPAQEAAAGVGVGYIWSSGSAITPQGLFVSVRLTVTGATYPTSPTDAAVFAGELRVQAFQGGTLLLNQNLTRLPGASIWYYRSKTFTDSGITQIKVIAAGATGVTLRLDDAIIHSDASAGNAEIEARNTAIAAAVAQLTNDDIAASYRQDHNFFTTTAVTANSGSAILNQAIPSQTLTHFSVAFILDVVGAAYPSVASDISLTAQVFSGATLRANVAPVRIGSTNIWVIHRAGAGAGPHTTVKLQCSVPTGATVTIRDAHFNDGQSLPLVYDIRIATAKAEAISSATAAAAVAAASIADARVGVAFSNFPGLYPTDPWTAIAMAKIRCVAIGMDGDSNQIKDGNGWDDGLNYAMVQLGFPQYATGIYAGNGHPNQGATSAGVNFGASSGAPAEQDAFWPSADLAYDFNRYAYIADGDTFTSGFNGLVLLASSPMVNDRLVWRFAYSPFNIGAGSFRPAVRRETSPFTGLVTGALISTYGEPAYTLGSLELPATTREFDLGFKFFTPGSGVSVVGPFICYWHRLEAVDRAAGFAISTMQYQSGDSMYDLASIAIGVPDIKWVRYFEEERRPMLARGQRPIYVEVTNEGLNSRNETLQPSLGPGAFTDADGPDAWIDNFKAKRARKEAMWVAAGGDVREYFCVLIASHVTADPEDSELVAYRVAGKAYAEATPRTAFFDMSEVMTAAEALALGDYMEGGSDRNHLLQQGNRRYMLRMLQKMLPL
jgi:hypothetical protein